jgi:hypothetical protein
MEFISNPSFMNIICFLQLFDKTLADVAKGSDIIGKNLDLYRHIYYPLLIFLLSIHNQI